MLANTTLAYEMNMKKRINSYKALQEIVSWRKWSDTDPRRGK
jgi:hypothetical protein